MGLNVTSKNLQLDAWGAVALFASLHEGAPGANGANEIGTREAIAWVAADAGVLAADVDPSGPVFDVAAGKSVVAVGFWSAVTVGTFYGFGTVDTETFTNAGTYEVTGATITMSDPA